MCGAAPGDLGGSRGSVSAENPARLPSGRRLARELLPVAPSGVRYRAMESSEACDRSQAGVAAAARRSTRARRPRGRPLGTGASAVPGSALVFEDYMSSSKCGGGGVAAPVAPPMMPPSGASATPSMQAAVQDSLARWMVLQQKQRCGSTASAAPGVTQEELSLQEDALSAQEKRDWAPLDHRGFLAAVEVGLQEPLHGIQHDRHADAAAVELGPTVGGESSVQGKGVVASTLSSRGSLVPKGTEVVLKGLVAKPENNGLKGTIMAFLTESGKYRIGLEGGRIVTVKASNLEVTAPPLAVDGQPAGMHDVRLEHFDLAKATSQGVQLAGTVECAESFEALSLGVEVLDVKLASVVARAGDDVQENFAATGSSCGVGEPARRPRRRKKRGSAVFAASGGYTCMDVISAPFDSTLRATSQGVQLAGTAECAETFDALSLGFEVSDVKLASVVAPAGDAPTVDKAFLDAVEMGEFDVDKGLLESGADIKAYAVELVKRLGLSAHGMLLEGAADVPRFCAGADGDADRDMILGKQFLVSQSDFWAIIVANVAFAMQVKWVGGLTGCATDVHRFCAGASAQVRSGKRFSSLLQMDQVEVARYRVLSKAGLDAHN